MKSSWSIINNDNIKLTIFFLDLISCNLIILLIICVKTIELVVLPGDKENIGRVVRLGKEEEGGVDT